MIISIRLRAIVTTIFATIIFIIFRGNVIDINQNRIVDLPDALVKSLILAFIVFLGVSWTVGFRIKKEKILTISLFPSFMIFLHSLFTELSLYQIFGLKTAVIGSVMTILFIMLVYFSTLNSNILYISTFKSIPLEKAARTVQFIFSLITSYIMTLITLSLEINFFLKLFLMFVCIFFVSYQTFWAIGINFLINSRMAFIISILIISLVIALSMWPLGVEYISLTVSACLYVMLGLGIEPFEKISKSLWIEYILVLISVILVLLAAAEWGINGRIIG